MMTPLPHYRIMFHSQVQRHLHHIDKKYHSEIQRVIDQQLSFEPDKPTRNRKPLNETVYESEWELRCGFKNQIRVFYRIYPDDCVVHIIAVGEKHGNRLIIGGMEY
jgi:mRNA-degrading endonuclease RelE of RelBE toxin-antitoxin system